MLINRCQFTAAAARSAVYAMDRDTRALFWMAERIGPNDTPRWRVLTAGDVRTLPPDYASRLRTVTPQTDLLTSFWDETPGAADKWPDSRVVLPARWWGPAPDGRPFVRYREEWEAEYIWKDAHRKMPSFQTFVREDWGVFPNGSLARRMPGRDWETADIFHVLDFMRESGNYGELTDRDIYYLPVIVPPAD